MIILKKKKNPQILPLRQVVYILMNIIQVISLYI